MMKNILWACDSNFHHCIGGFCWSWWDIVTLLFLLRDEQVLRTLKHSKEKAESGNHRKVSYFFSSWGSWLHLLQSILQYYHTKVSRLQGPWKCSVWKASLGQVEKQVVQHFLNFLLALSGKSDPSLFFDRIKSAQRATATSSTKTHISSRTRWVKQLRRYSHFWAFFSHKWQKSCRLAALQLWGGWRVTVPGFDLKCSGFMRWWRAAELLEGAACW